MATPRPDSAARSSDPEVEGFLALLAARRAPKTVEAYRRDLRALADWLGGSERSSRQTFVQTRRRLAPIVSNESFATLRAAYRPRRAARARGSDGPAARLYNS